MVRGARYHNQMRRLRAESLQIPGYEIVARQLTVLEDDQRVGLKGAFGLGQAEGGVGQQAEPGPPGSQKSVGYTPRACFGSSSSARL